MEIDVINQSTMCDGKKQRYRFNAKSSDMIRLCYGFLCFQRIATDEKAEIKLKGEDRSSMTAWEGQVSIYLEQCDFDAFRAALDETSAEVTEYTLGDEDE